jgi:hypothetical protein
MVLDETKMKTNLPFIPRMRNTTLFVKKGLSETSKRNFYVINGDAVDISSLKPGEFTVDVLIHLIL